MIKIKSEKAIAGMRLTGNLLARVFATLPEYIVPGISTHDLDQKIESLLQERALVSQSKGYMGYKHATCISLNDVIVHGVPSRQVVLKNGDLVKIDICARHNGFCADMARCFFVGDASKKVRSCVNAAQASLDEGIARAVVGGRLSDISSAIQKTVESAGYSVIRDFCGHGIGEYMHEDPEILNYGKPGKGPVLRHGMAFAIEPMISCGSFAVSIDEDGWTARTTDGSLAAHVEDTVIITESGPEVVTRLARESSL